MTRSAVIALAAAGLVLAGCEVQQQEPAASDPSTPNATTPAEPLAPQPPAKAPPPAEPGGDQIASDVVDPEDELEAEAPEEEPESPEVRLRLEVRPETAKAFVFWGRKRLGRAPLDFRHPRNSGPMDIVIKAEGFLDYHTRLFTDRSEKLVVSMVRPTQTHTLLGYRRMPDAGVPPRPDAGAPRSPRPARADAGVAPARPSAPRYDAGPAFVVPKAIQF